MDTARHGREGVHGLRLRAGLPFPRAALNLLVALVLSTPGLARAESDDDLAIDDLSVPAAIPEPALAWAGFAPVTYASASDAHPWQTTIDPPKGTLKYMILGFADVEAAAGDYRIEIRDEDARLYARYDAAFLAGNPRFSTPPVPGRRLILTVTGTAPTDPLRFKIDRLLTTYVPTISKSLVPNLKVGSQMSAAEKQLGRGVAKLIIADTEVCTGFLVAADTLVTNQHCLRQSLSYANSAGKPVRLCGDIAFAFDYLKEQYTKAGNPKCASVAAAVAPPVDVAVLKFDAPLSDGAGRVYPLAKADPGADGVPTQVFQHPWGLPLGLVTGCAARAVGGASPKLEHSCSTIGGASGSPLLNDKGEVIGIHSNGFIADGATSIEVMKKYYEMCGEGACPGNKGTRVSKIKEALGVD